MGSLFPSSNKRRWRYALMLLGLTAVVMAAFSAAAAARLPQEGPEGLPEDYAPEPLATEWIEGALLEHLGCHFDPNGNYRGTVMKSGVWYANKDGKAQPPKVGEIWYGAAYVALYNPCIGKLAVDFVVKPPPHTTFAVSANHPVTCEFMKAGGSAFTDVTADRSVCPTGVSQTAQGWSLGMRDVPSYSHFVIRFPLKSSAPLNGLAGPNGGDKLSVVVTPDNADTGEPYVHVNVNTAQPAQPAPAAQATVSPEAFLNCLWDNPNNPGPC
jgi:hypothetical protein